MRIMKSSNDIADSLESKKVDQNFIELYILSVFYSNSVFTEEYKLSTDFKDTIQLTNTGIKLFHSLQTSFKDLQSHEILFLIFMQTHNIDVFIDTKKTSIDHIKKSLHKSLKDHTIQLPWIFGRLLYDRFNENGTDFNANKVSDYNQTINLLKDTPQGVFQMAKIIAGPFGIIESSCNRILKPTLNISLWHCSDVACRTMHDVTLISSNSSVIYDASEYLNMIDTTHDSCETKFRDALLLPDYYDDNQIRDLPYLIGNSFSQNEMRNILKHLLENTEIRKFLPRDRQYKTLFSKPAGEIVKNLSSAECLQLILIVQDNTIIQSIEILIDDDAIHIPVTEIRDSHIEFRQIIESAFMIKSECSNLGIRTKSTRENISLSRLNRVINILYGDESNFEELEWRLKTTEGKNLHEKLDTYLHTADPRVIVEKMLLDTSKHTKKIADIVNIPLPSRTTTTHEINRLIDKILWKLSFTIPTYPNQNLIFWERLESLTSAVLIANDYNEADKSAIRSEAVNLFISLEHILELSLSFCTWALLSDHCSDTFFIYNPIKAQQFMIHAFNGSEIIKSSDDLIYDADGKITLYPLIQGFLSLSKILESKRSDNPELHKKSNDQLPGYYDKSDLLEFPFTHKIHFLDLHDEDKENLIKSLENITKQLVKNDICNIRNKLEHFRRNNFPEKSAILNAITAIKSIVQDLEEAGFCPLVSYHTGTIEDQYERETHTFKDYRGKELAIKSPSKIHIPQQIAINDPQIIVSRMRIRNSNTPTRFKLSESSDYVDIWREFPREY